MSAEYKNTLEYLESLKQHGMVLGLENMKNLCQELENPQERMNFVHIAGTNGKGSVLAYVSEVLKKAGYKVGRYLSPVLQDYRESIQINGKWITKKDLCSYTVRVKKSCEKMLEEGQIHPTSFEFETAMALLYFAEKECDMVVLETGMGGALDATNIIKAPVVAVFSSVSMDHMGFLGETLTEIAAQKAGILKTGCRAVTTKQKPEVMEVLEARAGQKDVSLRVADSKKAVKVKYGLEKQSFVYGEYGTVEIHLAGKHQIENAILAIEAIKALEEAGFPVGKKAVLQGLAEARWQGRFSVLSRKPLFLVDGAHNEDGAEKLADSLRLYFPGRRIVYIMGVLRDKEYEKIIAQTYAYAEHIITLTPPDNPRALSGLELALAVKEYHPNVTGAGSVEEAVEMACLLAGKDGVVISFGSLSYLGRLIFAVENRK